MTYLFPLPRILFIAPLLFLAACSFNENFRNDSLCFDSSMTKEEQFIFSTALDTWKTKANPRLNDKITASIQSQSCDWYVFGMNFIDSADKECGKTTPDERIIQIQHISHLRSGDDQKAFLSISLHELGHLFTGPLHSDFPEDIMYPSLSFSDLRVNLTENDLNRGNNHDWNNW